MKNFIADLNQKGGPSEADYYHLDRWMRQAHHYGPTSEEVEEIFGDEVLNRNSTSILSRIFYNPRGYYGSFDIMQDLYNQDISPTIPQLQMTWDAFVLSQIATVAISHRMEVVKEIGLQAGATLNFLDVACGPGIALTTLGNCRGTLTTNYLGVDQDPDAIAFCQKYKAGNQGQFKQYSLLEATRKQLGSFDVVWCSGLFDYIKARGGFIAAARRLVRLSEKVTVIGNMGPYNLARPFMEMMGWRLDYRTRAELDYLGSEIQKKDPEVKRTHVKTDPTGIQHYLYIEKV